MNNNTPIAICKNSGNGVILSFNIYISLMKSFDSVIKKELIKSEIYLNVKV